MKKHRYKEGCPDCRPVFWDLDTQAPLPANHPMMVSINRIWDAAPLEERQAFIDFTTFNERSPEIQAHVDQLNKKWREAQVS